jgi:hypothetical protein
MTSTKKIVKQKKGKFITILEKLNNASVKQTSAMAPKIDVIFFLL